MNHGMEWLEEIEAFQMCVYIIIYSMAFI